MSKPKKKKPGPEDGYVASKDYMPDFSAALPAKPNNTKKAKDQAVADVANLEDCLTHFLEEAEACIKGAMKEKGLPLDRKKLEGLVGVHYWGDVQNSVAVKASEALCMIEGLADLKLSRGEQSLVLQGAALGMAVREFSRLSGVQEEKEIDKVLRQFYRDQSGQGAKALSIKKVREYVKTKHAVLYEEVRKEKGGQYWWNGAFRKKWHDIRHER